MKQMTQKKTTQELRKFGLVMAAAFCVFGGLMLWRGKAAGPYVLGLGVAFLLLGLVLPGALRPIEQIWMAFAEKLSIVSTFVILSLTYYLVMTPVGVLTRLMGKDLLQTKLEPSSSSYWLPVDLSPSTRPDKPY